jgi:phage terminase small subunit
MPSLKNPKHERFAQEVAKGATLERAYAEAGYKPSRANAARLMKCNGTQVRIDELLQRGAQRAELTVQSLIEEADDVRVKAMEAKQFSAAIAAIKEMGVLSGLRVEKSERKKVGDVGRLSDEELEAIITDARARDAGD